MNLSQYKAVLVAREQELVGDIKRQDEAVLDSPTAEVGDQVDAAVSDLSKTTAVELSTNASDNLAQVRDALTRMDQGVYGKCVECGDDIGEARLNAVPWTPYCLRDQEKREEEAGNSMHATL